MKLRCSLLVFVLSLASATHAQKKSILFDASHQGKAVKWTIDDDACGSASHSQLPDPTSISEETPETFWSGALSALAIDLVKGGYAVDTLPPGGRISYGDKKNEQDLSKYSVYVIIEPKQRFLPEQIADIQKFVQAGGGLFLIGDEAVRKVDWDPPKILTEIGTRFGITFNNRADQPLGKFDDKTLNFTDRASAITGITDRGTPTNGLLLTGSTSMVIGAPAEGHAWRSTEQRGAATGVVFATATAGTGRVAALGDSAVLGDRTGCSGTNASGTYGYQESDNRLLVLNAFDWLAGPKNGKAPSLRITASPTDGGYAIRVESSGTLREVEYLVNGRLARTLDTPPYVFEWNTRSLPLGDYEIQANGVDSNGQIIATTKRGFRVVPPTRVRWTYWLLGAAAAALLAMLLVLRLRRLRVTNVIAPDAKNEGAFSFFLKSRLRCESRITWSSQPSAPLDVALYRNNEPFVILPNETSSVPFPAGKHHFLVVFSKKAALRQPTAISVNVVVWPRIFPWRKTTSFAKRELRADVPTPQPVGSQPTEHRQRALEVVHEHKAFDDPSKIDDDTLPPLLYDTEAIERVVLNVVNAIIRTTGVDRPGLVARLRSEGVRALIKTPYRVPESANSIFKQHWFEEDARTGTWLWVPVHGGAEFIVVPFDFRSFARSSMLSYLSSLYEGVVDSEKSVSEAAVRFITAARIAQGEDDSFRIVRRGQLTALGSAKTARDRQPPAGGASDTRDLNRELQALAIRVGDLERAQRGNKREDTERWSYGSREDLKQLTHRLDEISSRSERQWKQVAAAVQSLQSAVDTLRERFDADERSTTTELPSAPSIGSEKVVPESAPALPVPFDLSEERQSAFAEPDLEDFVFTPAPPLIGNQLLDHPSLPRGWEQRLASSRGDSGFIDAGAYSRSLRKAYEELRSLDSRQRTVTIVHLLPNVRGSYTDYEVHFDEASIGSNAMMEFRCANNPAARTPPQQFFIGWNHGDKVSIVCPPGEYSPVTFDLTPLVHQAPGLSFVIREVLQPATLERSADSRYRVISLMTVTIA